MRVAKAALRYLGNLVFVKERDVMVQVSFFVIQLIHLALHVILDFLSNFLFDLILYVCSLYTRQVTLIMMLIFINRCLVVLLY